MFFLEPRRINAICYRCIALFYGLFNMQQYTYLPGIEFT